MISKKLKDRQLEAIAKLRTALYMRLNERSGWSDSDIWDFKIMFDETVREVIENDDSIVEKGIERPVSEVKEPVICKNIPIHKNSEGIPDCGYCNSEVVSKLKHLKTFKQNGIWFFNCDYCEKPNVLPQEVVDKQVTPIDNHNGHESVEAVPGSSFSSIERITRLEKAFLESRRMYENDMRKFREDHNGYVVNGDDLNQHKMQVEARLSALEKDLAFLKVKGVKLA